MADLSKLNESEKVFLAGCLKAMVMADGNISSEEAENLEKVYSDENFADYEESLEKFEAKVKVEHDFWTMADSIKSQEVRDIILTYVYEVSRDNGMQDQAQQKLYSDLEANWKE